MGKSRTRDKFAEISTFADPPAACGRLLSSHARGESRRSSSSGAAMCCADWPAVREAAARPRPFVGFVSFSRHSGNLNEAPRD
jgi:hypothetical protein